MVASDTIPRSDSRALNVTGDRTIDRLLTEPGVVAIPARTCRFDGFNDDTLGEYANSSIFRPPSVQKARLVSSLSLVLHRHHGPFHLGIVMYDSAGAAEELSVWIGSRLAATIQADWNDNRRHLIVIPELTHFRGGELIRFITKAGPGPYRIENIVLLPRCPAPTEPHLEIHDQALDPSVQHGTRRSAVVTWLTNRPSQAEVSFFIDGAIAATCHEDVALVNHEVSVQDLPGAGELTARIVARPAEAIGLDTNLRSVVDLTPTAPAVAAVEPEGCRFPMAVVPRSDTPLDAADRLDAWPTTWGVALLQGVATTPENVRLLNVAAAEREIRCQVTPETRWPDGSIRWALLDFQAPLSGPRAAGDDLSTLLVEAGPIVRRLQVFEGNEISVEDVPNGIVVTTGPARLEIPRHRLVIPGHLSLRNPTTGEYEPVLGGPRDDAILLTGDDGTLFRGVVVSAAVELAGPERVVVRVDARHVADDGRRLFRSILRIHLFRGQSFVRLFHTFENDEVAHQFTTIRSLVLRCGILANHDEKANTTVAIEGPALAMNTQSDELRLIQTLDTTYEIDTSSGESRRVDGRAEGCAEVVRSNGSGVIARVRDFWHNYPKSLTAGSRSIEFGICPWLPDGSFPVGHPDEDRLYYYLLDGVYRFKCGVARTHEILFAPFVDGPGQNAARAVSQLFQAPPVVRVPSAVYSESGALNEVAPRDPERLPDYEQWVDAALGFLLHDREQNHDYGMLNFGDWYGERRYNWGNMEYDSPLGYTTEFLRGGDSRFYALAEQAARHLTDVDTCHHDPDPLRQWGQYAHCLCHVGDYYPRGYREAAIAHGPMENSHTWVEGLFLLSLLTGETRFRESAIGTTRRIAGARLNDFDFNNCRDCGWPLIHVMGAYQATGERYYLNAARVIVERVLERQRSSGGWDRLMVPGHCFCDPPRHTGEAGFMVGVLLDGLKRYHQATGDPRVSEAIVRAAGFLIRDMWVPELSCFRYTSCPRSAPSPEQNIQVLEGLAYAYRLSGDEGIRSICLIATKSVLGQIPLKFSHEIGIRILLRAAMQVALGQMPAEPPRGIGKELSTWLRSAPHILYDVSRMATGPIHAETIDIDA